MNKVGTNPTGLVDGVLVSPSQSLVFCNGHPVLVDGDLTYPHSLHNPSPIPSTSAVTHIQGKRVLREGDVAICGHILTGCESHVFSS